MTRTVISLLSLHTHTCSAPKGGIPQFTGGYTCLRACFLQPGQECSVHMHTRIPSMPDEMTLNSHSRLIRPQVNTRYCTVDTFHLLIKALVPALQPIRMKKEATPFINVGK
ncbi:hypothetical protein ABE142_09690 [Paenibacillus alvei]|uniref:hypothetical protein n=1 Tax=Paenibacillus alvei TaxID=44250 RepID=UPI003D2C378F